MKPDNYPIVIFWSDADEAYIADLPDLTYCSVHGATPEEALRELLVAREMWLESAHEHGATLPDPRASRFLPDIARQMLGEALVSPLPAPETRSDEAGAA